MSDSQELETKPGSDVDVDQMAAFEFPVAWDCLIDPDALLAKDNLPSTYRAAGNFRDPDAQWSMVVPRMTNHTAAAATLTLPVPASFTTPLFAAPRYVAPKFEVSLDTASLAVKTLLIAAVVMLLVPGWRDIGSPGARAVRLESSMNQAEWIRQSVAAGTVILHRQSLVQNDYRLDFLWRPSATGVTWFVRFEDPRNYGGLRIKPVPMAPRMFVVEHFAVLNGAVRSRATKLVVIPKQETVAIRTDAAGNSFHLYVNGNPVTQWTDPRLTSGAIGFFEDNARQNDIQSIRISSR